VPPLASALAAEENRSAVRRLKELLIGFGPAARGPARELRSSPNPAVRRAAVELLRAIGGDEALADLKALLDDPDPQVQRDALRGIVQIGSAEAYAMLEGALKAGSPQTRETILQALGSLRDERAAPLLIYILRHTGYRGAEEALYLSALDALGRAGGDAESVEALKGVLYRGQWWAPARTARLRLAAARALHAMSRPEADQVLQQAAERGGRGVRSAATQALASPRRPRQTGGSA
jgi:HEAT repeat protein